MAKQPDKEKNFPVPEATRLRRALSGGKRQAMLSASESESLEGILATTRDESSSTAAAYYEFALRLSEYFRLEEIDLIMQCAKKAGLS